MKKRLRDKYIIILLIATSFLSVLYYINESKIFSFETDETDYSTNDSFLENTFSLGTSNEIFFSFFIENVPKDNTNCSIEEFLKKNEEYLYIRDHFDDFFEPGDAARGPHKRFRYRSDVHFKNSPFDLFPQWRETAILTYIKTFRQNVNYYPYPNTVHTFDFAPGKDKFDQED